MFQKAHSEATLKKIKQNFNMLTSQFYQQSDLRSDLHLYSHQNFASSQLSFMGGN